MEDLVAVVGPGAAGAELDSAAEEVGSLLARRGVGVVCGGLGGVMAAACRGARAAGGLTIGLLPGTDRAGANPFVDVAIPTGLGEARNLLVVRAALAVIAVGGEYGTLSEIAFALKMGTPVVGLASWQLPSPPAGAAPSTGDTYPTARDPADAVEQALGSSSDRPKAQEGPD